MTTKRTTLRTALLLAATGWWLAAVPIAIAQIKQAEQPTSDVRYGKPQVLHYRAGVRVHANRGPVRDVRAMVAVPLACEEQQVKLVEEDISPQVDKVTERPLAQFASGGVRQMLVTIPTLPGGQKAHAIRTYEVTLRSMLPPEDTTIYHIPKRPDRELRYFLNKSPYIEVGHRKVRAAVKEALATLDSPQPKKSPNVAEDANDADDANNAEDNSTEDEGDKGDDASDNAGADSDAEASSASTDEEPASPSTDDADESSATSDATESSTAEPTDWQRVEALYDFVREKIEYVEGPDQSAVKTLLDGQGDCQAISALFVAMCRTAKIPARIVWVHGHCYPEFYLEEAPDKGHWFPCESSGMRAFGEMPVLRTILQKGDRFNVPERRGETLRYASDYLIGLPASRGSGKPSSRYIHEQGDK